MRARARIHLIALILAGTALAASAGCGMRALTANTSGGGGTGVIGFDAGPDATFRPTRDVDMLFLIDNSSGTRLLQDNLLRNFPTFITALSGLAGGLPNLHIAVVTSDLGAGDGSISGCSADGGDAGKFQYTARGTCTSTTLDPGATFISSAGGMKNFAGNIEDVFTCIAALGNSGCGFEQPLAAVMRALGADGRPMPAENQGFLRQSALLFIVFLTDEDDCSVPPGSALFDTISNQTLASPLGPPANFRCNEHGHLCNGAKPPRLAPTGNVNDVVTLDGCASAEGAGMLTPLATLRAQVRSLKPFPDEQILVAAIAGPSTPYTVQWRAPSTSDTGPWPAMKASCTASDFSSADPAVRINEFAASFGGNGQTSGSCVDSLAPILSTLATQLAAHIPVPLP
jgi:hypothetical protein